MRELLQSAHRTLSALHEVGTSEQREYAQVAGKSINAVLTAINAAFDFEQIGGRLQRAFHFIGSLQFAEIEDLISLYDFPRDMFYAVHDSKRYQTEHSADNLSPKLKLGRLLQHLERSMLLLHLAQRVADRHTKKHRTSF